MFIDGVGDEVTIFFVAIIVGIITFAAWWSTGNTGYRHERYRTIIIFERNVRYLYRILSRQPSIHTGNQNIPLSNNSNYTPESDDPDTGDDDIGTTNELAVIEQPTNEPSPEVEVNETDVAQSENAPSVSQEYEMNHIVNAMDTDTNALRNRRLAFFNKQPSPSEATSSDDSLNSSAASNETENTQNGSNELENTSEEPQNKSEENTETSKNDEEKSKDNIRVRLKFLNDELKEVEGSLQEQVGEFKRRHFQGELSARKLVRLIFNGQVLQREGATLQSCGLFDNCVVHCLVHPPRTASQFAQAQQQLGAGGFNNEPSGSEINQQMIDHMIPTIHINPNPEEREWDLGHVLLTMLASILSVAWYCHIRFSSLFGIAASVSMLGLTAIYLLAVICVYYPDNNNINVIPNNNPNANPPTNENQEVNIET